MTSLSARAALFVGALGAAAAVLSAPAAIAQPPVAPVCEVGETPANANCRTACPGGAPTIGAACTQPGTAPYDRGMNEETHPGANPHIPVGTNPQVPFGTHTNVVIH